MRTLLTKQQRADFVRENWKLQTFTFKWTISRARDTYGYNICTLRDKRGNKLNSNCGGGYDMQGTALGDFINDHFSDEIKKLSSDDFYGLSHYNPNAKTSKRRFLKRATSNTRTYVDGGCGFDSMRRILEKIGFQLNWVKKAKNESIYNLSTN